MKNLTEWTEKDGEEFKRIFGIDGVDSIQESIIVGDKIIDNSKSAKELMQDGIERIKEINSQMIRIVGGKRLCFYINNTICGNFFAVVDKYMDRNYEVNIAGKFFKASVFGKDSQVSTLCHEMSHFVKTGAGGITGGMNTDDLNKDGLPIDTTAKNHTDAADNFIKKKSPLVFKNAYNIERYFIISLDTKTQAEVNALVKKEMEKPLEIIVKTTPPDIKRELTKIEKENEKDTF